MRLCTLLVALILAAPVNAAAAGQEVTLVTRDGRTVHGELLSETERGFLVATPDATVLVEYAQVQHVTRGPPASAAASPSRVDVGIGGGVVWGPTIAERHDERFFVVGPVLQLPIELPGERAGVRFTPTLLAGFVGTGIWRKFGELSVDTQLRIHASASYSVGIGALLGAGLSTSGLGGDGLGSYGVVGPSITPLDLRFGDGRQHELQLSIALTIDFGHGSSGVDAVRPVLSYAFHF